MSHLFIMLCALGCASNSQPVPDTVCPHEDAGSEAASEDAVVDRPLPTDGSVDRDHGLYLDFQVNLLGPLMSATILSVEAVDEHGGHMHCDQYDGMPAADGFFRPSAMGPGSLSCAFLGQAYEGLVAFNLRIRFREAGGAERELLYVARPEDGGFCTINPDFVLIVQRSWIDGAHIYVVLDHSQGSDHASAMQTAERCSLVIGYWR